MDSKKKMIIAISAFAMLIVATVVAVVAVLAAQQVTIKSTVNIQYTADANVIGSVTASYKQESGTTQNLGSKSFTGAETGTPNQDLTPVGNINFVKETNDFVEFTFEFSNTSTVAGYTATLSFTDGTTENGTLTNMTLSSKTSAEGTYSEITNVNLASIGSVTVAKGENATFILKVALTDATKDAAFTGTLQWTLAATRS